MSPAIVSTTVRDRADLLRPLALFEGLDEHELVEIATRTHILDFADGDTIVPEGEEGLGFYIVLDGSARVDRDGASIARLARGDFFGEVAILEGTPRTATVVAEGAMRCAGVLRMFFKTWLARHPRVAMRIIEEEGRRLPPEPD